MPLPIRYTATNVSNSVRLGNIALGVNAVDYGPSTTSGWAAGVSVPSDGYDGEYAIYYLSGTNLRIRKADTFTLTTVAGQIMGVSTYASTPAALSALAAAGYTVTNTTAPPNLVTSGSVFYVNAGLIMSYPRTNSAWYDISGNTNNGTLTNGPTFDSIGAIVFDGTNDYVNCGNASNLQITVGTIGAWVKTSTPGGSFRSIIAKQNAWGLFVADSVLVTYDWGNAATRSTGINIADGTWKYVAMTFTETSGTPSNNAIVYLNGNAILTTTIKNSNQSVNVQIAEANANQYLNGSVAAAHVYNRVLSPSEILQNYYQGNIVTSSLVIALDAGNLVSYPGSGTTWTSLTGSNSATLFNGPAFNGNNGGNISFDGADDYSTITLPVSLEGNPAFSIGGWFKRSGTWNSGATWGIGAAGSNINSYNWSYDNSIGIDLYGNTTFNTLETYSLTEWKHIVWTYNGNGFTTSNVIIYINGVPYTGAGLTVIRNSGATPNVVGNILTLGRVSYNENGYYGKPIISNFQVYNRVLSSTEIQQNFNAYRNRFNL